VNTFKNNLNLNYLLKINYFILKYKMIDLFGFSICFLILAISGIFIRRYNLLLLIICIELSLLALGLIFIFLAYYLDDIYGKIITLLILAIAAAESALALGLLLAYYRTRGYIYLEGFTNLKN